MSPSSKAVSVAIQMNLILPPAVTDHGVHALRIATDAERIVPMGAIGRTEPRPLNHQWR